jgi:hypothetical protein
MKKEWLESKRLLGCTDSVSDNSTLMGDTTSKDAHRSFDGDYESAIANGLGQAQDCSETLCSRYDGNHFYDGLSSDEVSSVCPTNLRVPSMSENDTIEISEKMNMNGHQCSSEGDLANVTSIESCLHNEFTSNVHVREGKKNFVVTVTVNF